MKNRKFTFGQYVSELGPALGRLISAPFCSVKIFEDSFDFRGFILYNQKDTNYKIFSRFGFFNKVERTLFFEKFRDFSDKFKAKKNENCPKLENEKNFRIF